jgi:flagellar protein FlbD
MIKLHRLNNEEFVLNASLIEQVESTPDTIILLTNGKRLMVRDALDDVVRAVVAYKQLCHGAVKVIRQSPEVPALGDGQKT